MSHRLPARILASLALVVVALAIFVIVSGGTGASDDEPASSGASTTERTTSTTRTSTTSAATRGPRTYTVKPGDVLGAIAESQGTTLEELQRLNPDVDANALRAGQKLKLPPQ